MNKTGLISAAAGAAAFVTLAPAVAHAAPPGTCQYSAHLQLANGSYSADAATVECAGVIDGQPVHGGGFFEAWGNYSETGCTLTWRDNLFYARIPEAIEFFGPTYIDSEGGYTLSGAGPIMQLSGAGDNDGQPFTETGVARFTPDQTGCDIHSGTLNETVAIVDGGNGNPAAADAINRYEGSADYGADGGAGTSRSTSAPATVRHHSSISKKHHKHHGKVRRVHRTARRQRH